MNGVFLTLLRSSMALMDKLDDNEKVELRKFLLQRLPKSVEEQENERIVADFKKQTQRVNEILDSMKEKTQKDADEMLTNVPADADREAQQDQEDQENDHDHYEDDSGNVVNSSSVSGNSVEHEDEERLTRKYMRWLSKGNFSQVYILNSSERIGCRNRNASTKIQQHGALKEKQYDEGELP